jgi:hypothetical protein
MKKALFIGIFAILTCNPAYSSAANNSAGPASGSQQVGVNPSQVVSNKVVTPRRHHRVYGGTPVTPAAQDISSTESTRHRHRRLFPAQG